MVECDVPLSLYFGVFLSAEGETGYRVDNNLFPIYGTLGESKFVLWLT